jgi:hypothetical protein
MFADDHGFWLASRLNMPPAMVDEPQPVLDTWSGSFCARPEHES